MRRHNLTPLKMFLMLGGMMVVMIVCALASFVFHGGSLDPDKNRNPVYYVVKNGSEAMRQLEPEYIHYFKHIEDQIDYDELTYQESDITPEQLIEKLIEANQAVDGFQFTVKARTRINVPSQESYRYPWAYFTYILSGAGAINLHKRMVLYTDVNFPVWQIVIIDADKGITHISPRLEQSTDGGPQFSRFIAPPYQSQSEGKDYLTIQSFGRGLPEAGMKVLSVSQTVEYPSIYQAEFEIRRKTVESIRNSQMVRFEQYDRVLVWLDASLGFLCRRYQRDFSLGSNVRRKDLDVIHSDFLQTDSVWVPRIRHHFDSDGNLLEDYRVIDVQRIEDIDEYQREVQALPTPQPGDAYKGQGGYIRRANRPSVQN